MNKAVKIICKVTEVLAWILTALSLVLAIMSAVAPKQVSDIFQSGLSVEKYEVIYGQNGQFLQSSAIIFFISNIIAFSLIAMVFRNIYLVFKLSEGKSKNSKGATPFQADNVRMIREIGIFAVAIPVVKMIGTVITQLVAGDSVTVMLSLDGIVFGVIILALSRIFQYGVELEKDTEGLI